MYQRTQAVASAAAGQRTTAIRGAKRGLGVCRNAATGAPNIWKAERPMRWRFKRPIAAPATTLNAWAGSHNNHTNGSAKAVHVSVHK